MWINVMTHLPESLGNLGTLWALRCPEGGILGRKPGGNGSMCPAPRKARTLRCVQIDEVSSEVTEGKFLRMFEQSLFGHFRTLLSYEVQ
ncbi:hypothetical protein WCLP8_2220003 [uncultured Gammaproteobacteria bacterium]